MRIQIIKKMTEVDVKSGLQTVLKNIEEACKRRKPELQYIKPQLVAVAKLKPHDLIIKAYEEGQRHFGENYVQELEDKANNSDILERCKEIKWHFIGHLQSNKINKLLAVPNLYLIETVDSEKLAKGLNTHWSKFCQGEKKLKVMVQINTSHEDVKSGVDPSEAEALTKFVINECDRLEFDGFMTIGKYGYDPKEGINPDFLTLIKSRDEICKNLGLDVKEVKLSMGMSTDYEQAIELGSTYVRVGTSIFGTRPLKH